eukprot:182254_1
MGKFSNPKDIRKKLKEIAKKTRANNRRHKHNQNVNHNAQIPGNHNPQIPGNHNHTTNNKSNGTNKKAAPKKQYRGVWRRRKGGKRVYVALDGQEYDGKEARRKCIIDKQNLEKLAETKRQLQSPSFQHALNAMNDDNPQDIRSSLHHWHVPREIVHNYALKGITRLFKWQVECLSLVLNNNDQNDRRHIPNLIYSAPTSGGKTLISEILMIRCILLTRKKCILILPFVSLVVEKVNDLKSKLSCLGILVEAYHSNVSINSIEDADIICCTIEKANTIVNKMIEEDGLIHQVGCVVIDEFHYIGDAHRGWILEILISKTLFILQENVQIIGMSATLPNLQHIAQWMKAQLYITRKRPVTLTQYFKKRDVLYDGITKKQVRKLQQIHAKDREHVVTLCEEVTQKSASVLVFCQKKVWCKQCCKMIAECLALKHTVVATLHTKRKMIIEELKELPLPICEVLNVSIGYGVAYHHAGLTLEEREIIENGFRKNIINILVATSTLAAGVNLPARRVIFRTPKVGRNFLSPSKYKQMAGRAGRKGIDLYGESIVICKDDTEVNYVTEKLIDAPLEPIASQLSNHNNLQRFILEGFGTNLIKTPKDLQGYLSLSLQCTEMEQIEWNQQCQKALNWLIDNEFLQKTESMDIAMDIDMDFKQNNDINFNGTLEITNLGFATVGSGLDPLQSLLVFEEIAKTRKHGLYFTNSLHLCYLLSPIRNNGGNIQPNWEYFYECYMTFGKDKQDIAKAIGISEQVLCDYAHNQLHRPPWKSDNKVHIKYKRFYCSIILNKIIEEQSLYDIEKQFNIEGGAMQSLQTSAASFASSLSVFCIKLNWNCMAQIIAHFSQRLSYGVESELLPLMKISHMKAFRARMLYKYGLTTLQQIAEASLETIILALSSQSKFSTNDMQKKLIVINAQKIKFEAKTIYKRMLTKDQEENDD